jgi:hypothetical protein
MLLYGVGLGAALMYIFDPERGRGRRAYLREQFVGASNSAGERLGKTARDLRNRAQGVVARGGSLLPSGGQGEE